MLRQARRRRAQERVEGLCLRKADCMTCHFVFWLCRQAGRGGGGPGGPAAGRDAGRGGAAGDLCSKGPHHPGDGGAAGRAHGALCQGLTAVAVPEEAARLQLCMRRDTVALLPDAQLCACICVKLQGALLLAAIGM